MRFIVLLFSLSAIFGCSRSWYLDEWTVSGAKFAAISAMDMPQAETWFGSKAVYSDSTVSFRGESCTAPQFTVDTLREAEFRRLYRAAFTTLGIEGEMVEILEVRCPESWTQPGAKLIKADANTAYIPWDGVFFQLER